jgi:hypothetical protein
VSAQCVQCARCPVCSRRTTQCTVGRMGRGTRNVGGTTQEGCEACSPIACSPIACSPIGTAKASAQRSPGGLAIDRPRNPHAAQPSPPQAAQPSSPHAAQPWPRGARCCLRLRPTGTYSLLFGLQALTHKWIPSHILEHQLHLLKPMH